MLARWLAASPHKSHSRDQHESLKLMSSGADSLIVVRTGGGKTLLWQLPVAAADDDGLTMVVVPTTALEYDLKESTDRKFGKFFCVVDVRSEGGEAVLQSANPEPDPRAQAAAVIAMEWAARRPWRCQTECSQSQRASQSVGSFRTVILEVGK